MVGDRGLEYKPGSENENDDWYTDTTLAFIREILYRITGKTPYRLASEKIFLPLGMNDIREGCHASTKTRLVFRQTKLLPVEMADFPDCCTVTLDDLIKLARALSEKKLLSDKTWKIAMSYGKTEYGIPFENVNGIDGLYFEGPLGYDFSIQFSHKADYYNVCVMNEHQIVECNNGIWSAYRPSVRKEMESLLTYPENPKVEPYTKKNAWRAMCIEVEPEQLEFVSDAQQSLSWALADKAHIRPFVLMEGKRAIGLLLLKIDKAKDEYYFDIVQIDKRFQGRGYGKIMVQWGVEYLKSHGAKELTIGCNRNNIAARGLYESVGFVADKVYDEGVHLKLTL